jgi:tagatose 1,6-diphosphate aldolase GatY/KbaY
MLTSTKVMLNMAQEGDYAVGAFNVYNMEGVLAIVAAAEQEFAPAIIQLHPASLRHGGNPLVEMCLTAARSSFVPMSVHLDHSASDEDIRLALDAGLTSIMADGSTMAYDANVAFTGGVSALVHTRGGTVEAELGRLTGTEDDLTVPENLAKFTDPDQAADFVKRTGIDALAVCIGNAHGTYRSEPSLDFPRLQAIEASVNVPLVLHGASGLSEETIGRSIAFGVRKFNVNTEVRQAYMSSLSDSLGQTPQPDLTSVMGSAIEAMTAVVALKIQLFGSTNKG